MAHFWTRYGSNTCDNLIMKCIVMNYNYPTKPPYRHGGDNFITYVFKYLVFRGDELIHINGWIIVHSFQTLLDITRGNSNGIRRLAHSTIDTVADIQYTCTKEKTDQSNIMI